MTNRYDPHVLVLPEDDANRQIANGFVLDLHQSVLRRIQVLPEADGWTAVLDSFEANHIAQMNRFTERHMVLLIDLDGHEDRVNLARQRIPEHLHDRVFILGVRTEPEDLKRADLGSYETIGNAMAEDCRQETDTIWGHDLLRHNAGEIERLRQCVRPILFP